MQLIDKIMQKGVHEIPHALQLYKCKKNNHKKFSWLLKLYVKIQFVKITVLKIQRENSALAPFHFCFVPCSVYINIALWL